MPQTHTEKWEPSDTQVAMLAAGREVGYHRNISALCDEIELSPSTFYRWLKHDEGFRLAWEDLPRATIIEHMPAVVVAQLQKAIEGHTGAARLMIEMAGEIQQVMNVTYRHEIVRPDTYEEWLIYNLAMRQNLDPVGAIGELKRLTNGSGAAVDGNGENATGRPN